MAWEVEYAEEFGAWWDTLTEAEQDSIDPCVGRLAGTGPTLGRPYADTVKGSRFPHMKDLRVQHEGRPYRIFFAFNPFRSALLLIGGDKTGDDRFYETFGPLADAIYAQHLHELLSQ